MFFTSLSGLICLIFLAFVQLLVNPGVTAYETEGYLLKEGKASGGGKWQQRWFALKDYRLEYYSERPGARGRTSAA